MTFLENIFARLEEIRHRTGAAGNSRRKNPLRHRQRTARDHPASPQLPASPRPEKRRSLRPARAQQHPLGRAGPSPDGRRNRRCAALCAPSSRRTGRDDARLHALAHHLSRCRDRRRNKTVVAASPADFTTRRSLRRRTKRPHAAHAPRRRGCNRHHLYLRHLRRTQRRNPHRRKRRSHRSCHKFPPR